jgi:hypothetical protein
MNQPEIISGAYADPFPDAPSPVRDDGSVNWGAAMRADPGIKKCGRCGTYYWNLARVMRCTKCGAEFGDGVEGEQP